MAKKTHIKVRLVPESKPDSSFVYYAKKNLKDSFHEKVEEVLGDHKLSQIALDSLSKATHRWVKANRQIEGLLKK